MCFNTNHIEDIEPSANRECGGCVIKAWSDSPNVQTETIMSNPTKIHLFHQITDMQEPLLMSERQHYLWSLMIPFRWKAIP